MYTAIVRETRVTASHARQDHHRIRNFSAADRRATRSNIAITPPAHVPARN